MVVVITGILASVAYPSYQEYIYNAKLADGFVSMGAIRKEQIVYLNEHRCFPTIYNANTDGPSYVPGAKAQMMVEGSEYSLSGVLINNNQPPINPIPQGSWNYFRYYGLGFFWDNDGSLQAYGGPPSYNLVAGFQGAEDEVACTRAPGFTMESWGIAAAPNRHIAFNSAVAVLKAKNDFRGLLYEPVENCTFLVQILTADGGAVRSTPIIVLRE